MKCSAAIWQIAGLYDQKQDNNRAVQQKSKLQQDRVRDSRGQAGQQKQNDNNYYDEKC